MIAYATRSTEPMHGKTQIKTNIRKATDTGLEHNGYRRPRTIRMILIGYGTTLKNNAYTYKKLLGNKIEEKLNVKQ